jgi:hypothetical protein
LKGPYLPTAKSAITTVIAGTATSTSRRQSRAIAMQPSATVNPAVRRRRSRYQWMSQGTDDDVWG